MVQFYHIELVKCGRSHIQKMTIMDDYVNSTISKI